MRPFSRLTVNVHRPLTISVYYGRYSDPKIYRVPPL
jgi:hypothetical protein